MMRIVYGGGSNWGNKKKSKTGETVSRSREVADNAAGSGSTAKPAKNASESESKNTSRILLDENGKITNFHPSFEKKLIKGAALCQM